MKLKGITAYKSFSFDGIAVHDLDSTISSVQFSQDKHITMHQIRVTTYYSNFPSDFYQYTSKQQGIGQIWPHLAENLLSD